MAWFGSIPESWPQGLASAPDSVLAGPHSYAGGPKASYMMVTFVLSIGGARNQSPREPCCSPCFPPQGASANWWNHRHFQHHAKPNIFHKDPDVNMLHVFVLGEWQPIEVR